MPDIGAQVSASLDALAREFDIIAHNLANASTVGYKRRCNAFTQALDAQVASAGDEGTYEPASQGVFDFSQGHLVQTDRKLDLALYGRGFFVIETPEGPLYTRHGVFQTSRTGQIVDVSGRLVSGVSGPIVVPSNVDLSEVHVADDGRVTARGSTIGQLRIVEFPGNENQLIPAGQTCFHAPDQVEPTDVESPIVKQGFQEASNVRLIDEMVNMIMVSRLYEANMRLVSVNKDTTASMISVAMG